MTHAIHAEAAILFCPKCRSQHEDFGEWATRAHRTHRCMFCRHEWRPFLHTTVGVPFAPIGKDRLGVLVVPLAVFDRMSEYSCTIPTGPKSGRYWRRREPYVGEDRTEYVGGKNKTVKQLLGKDIPPITLARDSRGTVHQLVKKADVTKVLKQKAPAATKEDAEGNAIDKKRKADERKLKLRRKAIQLAIAEASKMAEKMAIADLLPLIVEAFAARAWNEVQRAVLDSRGVPSKAGNVEAQLTKLVRDANTNGDVAAIGLELAMRASSPWHQHSAGISSIWRDALKLTGVDFAELERQVTAESAVKGAKKKKPPAAKVAATAAKSKPAKAKKKAVNKRG